jgi:hypothetical protein
MKTSWILPDRQQTGTMLLDQSGCVEPIHTALELHKLPRAFTLGLPEELFLATRDRPVFFSQFARLGDGENLFAASLEAGKDVGGRAVVLTLLVQLHGQEMVQAESVADFKIPALEIDCDRSLLLELTEQFNERASSLNSLLTAVKDFPERRTFASEALRRSANRPEWMKKSYGIESGSA